MDNNDLEREEELPFSARMPQLPTRQQNQCDRYSGTPPISGRVERVLKMADGVILLVDAFEGPIPTNSFCIAKSLHLNLETDCSYQ